MKNSIKYSVTLSFEEILVLGKNSPHGKTGISKSFDLLIPNDFEIIDTHHGNVDCVFVSKPILAKIPRKKLLEANVFPYVSEKEIIKDDFKDNTSFTVVEES